MMCMKALIFALIGGLITVLLIQYTDFSPFKIIAKDRLEQLHRAEAKLDQLQQELENRPATPTYQNRLLPNPPGDASPSRPLLP